MDTTSRSAAPTPPPSSSSASDRRVIVLAGNPNSGKTSVFNALTGLRRKVGNYPGVTVDRIEGDIDLGNGEVGRAVDLPGCYSLYPRSEDERVARNVLLGFDPRVPRPDVVVAVVDASNLERNLYLATQLLETGTPVVVALNMVDVAKKRGAPIDVEALEAALRVPVVPVVGRTGHNMDALRKAIGRAASPGRIWSLSELGEQVVDDVSEALRGVDAVPAEAVHGEAIRLVTTAPDDDPILAKGGEAVRSAVAAARAKLSEAGVDSTALEAECRYAFCKQAAFTARQNKPPQGPNRSERIDKVLTASRARADHLPRRHGGDLHVGLRLGRAVHGLDRRARRLDGCACGRDARRGAAA